MIRRERRRAFRILAILLAAGLPCLSQFDTRSVTGVVTDKSGNALPGAAVQLENEVTLSVTSFITGKDGHIVSIYSIPILTTH